MRQLLSKEELEAGVQRMAQQVASLYGHRPLTIVGVLTGSVVLLADLIRLLDMPLRVGVVQASSYRGTERGELSVNADLMPDIQGRDVLLIDDILDSGHTLSRLVAVVQQMGATSVRCAVLLRKQGQQKVAFEPDFVGFEIPDEFVVGYGLDHNDAYRNLAYVAALDPADVANEGGTDNEVEPDTQSEAPV